MESSGTKYQTARHDAGWLKGEILINVVAYGAGTNSTAMIIGMYHKNIPVDLIQIGRAHV